MSNIRRTFKLSDLLSEEALQAYLEECQKNVGDLISEDVLGNDVTQAQALTDLIAGEELLSRYFGIDAEDRETYRTRVIAKLEGEGFFVKMSAWLDEKAGITAQDGEPENEDKAAIGHDDATTDDQPVAPC